MKIRFHNLGLSYIELMIAMTLSILLIAIFVQQVFIVEQLSGRQQKKIKFLQDLIIIQQHISLSALNHGYAGCQMIVHLELLNDGMDDKAFLERILNKKIISGILRFSYFKPLLYFNADSFINRQSILILPTNEVDVQDYIYLNTCAVTEAHRITHVKHAHQHYIIQFVKQIDNVFKQHGELMKRIKEFYFLSYDHHEKVFYHVKIIDEKIEIEVLSKLIDEFEIDKIHSTLKLMVKLSHQNLRQYFIYY